MDGQVLIERPVKLLVDVTANLKSCTLYKVLMFSKGGKGCECNQVINFISHFENGCDRTSG